MQLHYGNKKYMLSYDSWIEKKGTKLQGLSDKVKHARYQDYRLSNAVNGPKGPSGKKKKLRTRYKEGTNKKGDKMVKSLGSLSDCTRDYASALMNPWDMEKPPCIPDLITLPSYKFGARAKGTFTIGTAGCGFVAISPYTAVGKPSSGVGQYHVYYTTGSYALATYTDVGGTAGLQATYNDTSLIFDNISRKGFQFRTVGCGVKCRYIGSEINRSGRIVEYRQPNNQAITVGSSAADLLLNREANTAPNDRLEHYVQFRPSNQADLYYQDQVLFQNPTMVLFVEGGTVGQSFEYDAIWWFECTGQLLPSLSKSHSDPMGIAAVHGALPLHQPTGTPAQNSKSFLGKVVDFAKSSFSFIGPMIMESIGGAENLIPMATAMFM